MPEASPDFKKLFDYRARIDESVQAPRTRDCYRESWKRFMLWCGRANRCPFPASAETVILYLTDSLLAGGKIESARVYMNAVNDAHRSARIPIPEPLAIRQFLISAQRLRCEKPDQKTPLRIEDLRRICAAMLTSTRPADIRNRAVLTLTFATALRRSDIVALDLDDIRWVPKGIVVVLDREKQDQAGVGRLIGVEPGQHPETDAEGALRRYLEIRGSDSGPLFRRLRWPYQRLKPVAVANILKAAIRGIDLNPREYAAHSLRSGFVTTAVAAGVNEFTIARQTGHRSLVTLRRYFREGDPFRANASSMIGL